jgi:hypothetical protein
MLPSPKVEDKKNGDDDDDEWPEMSPESASGLEAPSTAIKEFLLFSVHA